MHGQIPVCLSPGLIRREHASCPGAGHERDVSCQPAIRITENTHGNIGRGPLTDALHGLQGAAELVHIRTNMQIQLSIVDLSGALPNRPDGAAGKTQWASGIKGAGVSRVGHVLKNFGGGWEERVEPWE